MRTVWDLLGIGLCAGCFSATDNAQQDAGPAVSFVPDEASFSAAFFIEAYCSGCHQPNFVAPNGHTVAIFSDDSAWQGPFKNPNWFGMLNYGQITQVSDAILCGVSPAVSGEPDDLPAGCSTLTDVAPGFFTQPEKFPPPGTASSAYGTSGPVCAFSADGHSCPQPSHSERLSMVAWVNAGAPYR